MMEREDIMAKDHREERGNLCLMTWRPGEGITIQRARLHMEKAGESYIHAAGCANRQNTEDEEHWRYTRCGLKPYSVCSVPLSCIRGWETHNIGGMQSVTVSPYADDLFLLSAHTREACDEDIYLWDTMSCITSGSTPVKAVGYFSHIPMLLLR